MTAEDFYARFEFNPSASGSLLGRGGFSSVYKVFDKVRKRYVAVKRSEVGVFTKFDLEREVKLANEIDYHPNILRYENVERITDRAGTYDYAIIKYYSEGNLDQVLSRYTLTDPEQRQILTGILRGLAHLHSIPIIHRDLKAANVLMDRDGNGSWLPVIADFGLSRMVDADVSYVLNNSQIAITPNYAAPEQYTENDALRPNTDLWAFGVMTYKMMTGRLPFRVEGEAAEKDTSHRIRTMVLEGKLPKDIGKIRQPYCTIIQKCLVVSPEKRVKRAEELLKLLEKEQPPVAVPNGQPEGFDGKTMLKGQPLRSPFDPPTRISEPATSYYDRTMPAPRRRIKAKPFLLAGLLLVVGVVLYLVVTLLGSPGNVPVHRAVTARADTTGAKSLHFPNPDPDPKEKKMETPRPSRPKVQTGKMEIFTRHHNLRVYIDGVKQPGIAEAGRTTRFALPVGQGVIFKIEYIEFGLTPPAEPLTVAPGQVFQRVYEEKFN